MEAGITQDNDFEAFLEDAGLNVMDYIKRDGRYRIRLRPGDVRKHKDGLCSIIRKAKGFKKV